MSIKLAPKRHLPQQPARASFELGFLNETRGICPLHYSLCMFILIWQLEARELHSTNLNHPEDALFILEFSYLLHISKKCNPKKPLLLSNQSRCWRGRGSFHHRNQAGKWPDLEESQTLSGQAQCTEKRHSIKPQLCSSSDPIPYYRCENTESETARTDLRSQQGAQRKFEVPGPSSSKTGFTTTLRIYALSPLGLSKRPCWPVSA